MSFYDGKGDSNMNLDGEMELFKSLRWLNSFYTIVAGEKECVK